jgi:hypothetical protein
MFSNQNTKDLRVVGRVFMALAISFVDDLDRILLQAENMLQQKFPAEFKVETRAQDSMMKYGKHFTTK